MNDSSVTRGRRISIVVPALNEFDSIPALLARLGDLRAGLDGCELELVLVDDGSTDGTVERLNAEAPAWLPVTSVRLSRSFGSHQAISAGLREAHGDCAVVLGADVQEPPSLVADFVDEWRAGADVVWGVRRSRTRGWRSELPSRAFSYLFTRYADLANYPPEGPSGVLVDRAVIDELNKLEESNRNVLALIAWLGYQQVRVSYDQLPREHGESRWTRRKMVKLAVDSLIQFSSMPLRAGTFTGLAVAALGMIYAAFLVVRSFFGVETPSGWPTILVVVLVLGGIQLMVIGIMGEYVWRAVEEVRGRPLYVVRGIEKRPERSHGGEQS
ncbi:glycosyltransferase family 2 protein [Nocardioides marmorisolisilvae]|uniref:glycosyltransferase family 2 protein n=1 Tax=Nocardioides marmorisolisilvae TaxID=1542737 RepID=UPI0016077263|nr:glycosyltransferase family 2 protein [Nocardioides marmorisolisilvae]